MSRWKDVCLNEYARKKEEKREYTTVARAGAQIFSNCAEDMLRNVETKRKEEKNCCRKMKREKIILRKQLMTEKLSEVC